MKIIETFQWVDWAVIVIVLVSTLISLKRGFLKEALSLVIWFLAVMITMVFHKQLEVLLQPYIESPSLTKLAAILSLFVVCLFVGGLFNLLMSHLVEFTGLSGTDRLLGMIFGALRGVIVVLLVLMVSKNILPVDEEVWWRESILIPHVVRLESWVEIVAGQVRSLFTPLVIA
jgi:membrane protein required for colicin V production